jgi:lipoprotein-anchoring transpeptidase ErfK/SrfK
VRRTGLAAFFLVVCAFAGVLSSAVLTARGSASPGQTTTTGSTSTSSTSSTTTTTTPAQVLPEGVTVGRVAVGGLTREEAYAAVRQDFERPLALKLGARTLTVLPERLGAVAYALAAVERARTAVPGSDVPLRIAVDGGKVRKYVVELAAGFDRRAVESKLFLRKLRPWISPDRPGRTLLRVPARQAIVSALVDNRKGPLRLKAKASPPTIGRGSFGPVIVIRRGSNRLFLYSGMRYRRWFGVATGQTIYPTPLGRFSLVVKWRNPWWYPPDSDWARGQSPIPPGPGNPLGTRWMGLSASGVGIHGTPDAASIGYSVSHGCIRMRIPEAEWLFEHVRIGTVVFIVSA